MFVFCLSDLRSSCFLNSYGMYSESSFHDIKKPKFVGIISPQTTSRLPCKRLSRGNITSPKLNQVKSGQWSIFIIIIVIGSCHLSESEWTNPATLLITVAYVCIPLYLFASWSLIPDYIYPLQLASTVLWICLHSTVTFSLPHFHAFFDTTEKRRQLLCSKYRKYWFRLVTWPKK